MRAPLSPLAMACSLVFELHGDLVRCISSSCGLHFEGLGAAARHLGRLKLIDQHLKRKMLAIETAFNIVRHITSVSASELKVTLDSVLRSQQSDEKKREEAAAAAATATAAAGGGDGGGGGGQGTEEGGGGSGGAHELSPAAPSVLPPGLEAHWAAERGEVVPAQLPGQTQETSRTTEDHGITRVELPPGKEMVFACSSENEQRPLAKAPPPFRLSFASASQVVVGLQTPASSSCRGEALQTPQHQDTMTSAAAAAGSAESTIAAATAVSFSLTSPSRLLSPVRTYGEESSPAGKEPPAGEPFNAGNGVTESQNAANGKSQGAEERPADFSCWLAFPSELAVPWLEKRRARDTWIDGNPLVPWPPLDSFLEKTPATWRGDDLEPVPNPKWSKWRWAFVCGLGQRADLNGMLVTVSMVDILATLQKPEDRCKVSQLPANYLQTLTFRYDDVGFFPRPVFTESNAIRIRRGNLRIFALTCWWQQMEHYLLRDSSAPSRSDSGIWDGGYYDIQDAYG